MIGLVALALTAPPPPFAPLPPPPAVIDGDRGPDATPIQYGVVSTSEMRLPISDSVRAATWDDLQYKPKAPVTVHLACIVWHWSGAPGACVQASRLPVGQKTIDWAKARNEQDAADLIDDPAATSLRRTAEQRVRTLLMPIPADLDEDEKASTYIIRYFDEVISPADARPAYRPGKTLGLSQVIMAKPLDTALLQDLFPATALRDEVTGRVTMICRIEKSLKLLCRDPGVVTINPQDTEYADDIRRQLLLASYQLVSTMQLAPRGKDGSDVAGQNLNIGISWQLPEE